MRYYSFALHKSHILSKLREMLIGGLQKCSLIDFPGKIAAVIFFQGCPWRCPYCHNNFLVEPSLFKESISVSSILEFLEKRLGQLDGVVLSGGEATLCDRLLEFIQKIRQWHYAIKLDTNGAYPERLQSLLASGMVDYCAMDLKGPWEQYAKYIGKEFPIEKVKQSAELIKNSGIAYEFRTTIAPQLHTLEDLLALAPIVDQAPRFALQCVQLKSILNPQLAQMPVLDSRLADPSFLKSLQKHFNVKEFIVR